MKSLKYSAASKIKRQKQQEKAQSSFLQTLKEDDEICTGLLDTLSDDYLGYLEDLMGKKSGRETKINQSKPQIISTTEKINPNTEYKCKINLEVNDDNLLFQQQKSDIQEPNQEIVSSIVFLQPKNTTQHQPTKVSENTLKPNQQNKTSLKNSPINQFKSLIKQQTHLLDVPQIKPKISSQRKNKSEDKILIKNIQGYLQSLSKIKPKPSLSNQIQTQSSQNAKKQHKNVEKLHSVALKNINSKQTTSKTPQLSIPKTQTKIHFSQKNQFFGNYQKKNASQPKFLRNKTQLEQKKDFKKNNCLGKIMDESQSEQSEQVDNDESFISLQSRDDSTIPVKNKIFFGQSSKKLKRRNEDEVMKRQKRELVQDIFSPYKKSSQDTSLELLLIKVISKYNKLLSKHSKCKFRMEELQKQSLKLQEQIQQKNGQIQRLTQINKQLIKDQQAFLKVQNKLSKTHQIDDRQFVQQYRGTFLDKQVKNLQSNLLKLNFKKNKEKDDKAINIQKMFIIDTLELFQKPSYLQNQPSLLKYQQNSNVTHKDNYQKDDYLSKKQKRSISCRQTYNKDQPSSQEFINLKKTSKHTKQIQNNSINRSLYTNTFSYQKINNSDEIIQQNNQRSRAFSQSHHSIPLKQKQTQQIQGDKFSFNSQFSIKFKAKNNQFNNNPPEFSVSDKSFKKNYLLLNKNEESQSTDSQLLEKLLTIRNSYQCHKAGKAQGNKTFFK